LTSGQDIVHDYRNALYEHLGAGIYLYKGSMSIDQLMQYEM
jgi:hypothetical protein